MTNAYKVVGIQIVPKNDLNNKSIVNKVAWSNLKNCRVLFEKLIIPANNIRSIKKQKGKKFNVVGIMNVQQGGNEALMNMQVSGGNSGLSKNIMQQFNDLVKPIN